MRPSVLLATCVTCLLLVIAATSCRAPAVSGAAVVKLEIEADGLYQVSAQALQAAGFDLTGARPEELTLSSGGEPVGFELVGQGQRRAVRFYGQALGSEAYIAQNIYWLSRAAQGGSPSGPSAAAGAPLAERAAPPDDIVVSTVVTATLRVEEQRLHHGLAGLDADRWVWQALSAPDEASATLAVPDPAAGSGRLRVRVIGNSTAPVTPNHHLVLSLNDVRLADAAWEGMGPHSITATVPAGLLRAGENRVTLTAPGDTGAPADAVLLDWMALDYPRELVLDDDELTFAGAAAGYGLRTDKTLAALWDITDPARPVAVTDYAAADGMVRFAAGGDRQFIAVTQAGLRVPAAVVAVDPASDLRDWPGGADMIIVTVPQFRRALEPLVAAREAQGLRVAVVDVAQVYDSFAAGRAGPAAIRALVQHAQTHWTPPAPRFLLLAGDASYDPRGYLKGTEADLVPTQLVATSFSGWTASDVWYALPEAGADPLPAGHPLLAVGRFPAQTSEQLAAMVAKTLEYGQSDRAADWRRRAFVVADNDEPGFASEAAAFAARLTGYVTQTVTLQDDGSQAATELRQAFEAGTGLIGYFGHGSVTLWAKEKILDIEEVGRLSNRDHLPIVFTVTCLSGLFEHPTTSSLGEALLRARAGGAVAGLVPSSAAVLSDQSVLAQALAQALASGPASAQTLGEAVLQAQGGLADSTGGLREILLTFNLLGDPALPLNR